MPGTEEALHLGDGVGGSSGNMAPEDGAPPKFLDTPLERSSLKEKHQEMGVSETLAERTR